MVYFKIMISQQEIEADVLAELNSQRQFLMKTGLKSGDENSIMDIKDSRGPRRTRSVAPETSAGVKSVKKSALLKHGGGGTETIDLSLPQTSTPKLRLASPSATIVEEE